MVKIGDLEPDSKYAIYLGGVQASGSDHFLDTFSSDNAIDYVADALNLYCLVDTMPRNALDQRFLFTYDGHVNRSLPGEGDMWMEMERNLCTPLGSAVERSDFHGHNSGLSPLYKDGDGQQQTGAHMVFHLGNFISLNGYLRVAGIQLVRDLTSDDVAAEAWRERVISIEEGLRSIYRTNMTANSSVRHILRSTGNVFLSGSGEGGGCDLQSLFGSVALAVALHQDKTSRGLKAEDGTNEPASAEESNTWDSIGEGVADASAHRLAERVVLTKEQKEICHVVHGMLLRMARCRPFIILYSCCMLTDMSMLLDVCILITCGSCGTTSTNRS